MYLANRLILARDKEPDTMHMDVSESCAIQVFCPLSFSFSCQLKICSLHHEIMSCNAKHLIPATGMLNISVIFTFNENSIVFFNSASCLKVSTVYHNLSFIKGRL